MGESQNLVTGELEGHVARTISLEGAAGPVEGVAIELHDQPLPKPDGVNLVAGDEVVDPGRRQAMLTAEVEEDPLEIGASDGRRAALIDQNPEQGAESPSAAASQADVLDRAKVQLVKALGLLECAGKLLLRKHPGQVEERSRNRCDGNARTLGAITFAQLAGHVDGDAGAAAAGTRTHGDVDQWPGSRPKLPQCRRASIGENRAWTCSQNRREPMTVRAQRSMADRVDAAMDPMQLPSCDPTLDRPLPEAEREELVAGDQAVLASREAGQRAVTSSSCRRGGNPFPPYLTANVCHPWRVATSPTRVVRETSGNARRIGAQ